MLAAVRMKWDYTRGTCAWYTHQAYKCSCSHFKEVKACSLLSLWDRSHQSFSSTQPLSGGGGRQRGQQCMPCESPYVRMSPAVDQMGPVGSWSLQGWGDKAAFWLLCPLPGKRCYGLNYVSLKFNLQSLRLWLYLKIESSYNLSTWNIYTNVN